MATAVELDATIVVREMESGGVYAHPWCDASLCSRATSVEAALHEQERFLTRYLQKVAAPVLPEFSLPRDAELLQVPVLLGRPDLPRRASVTSAVTVPCLRVPHDGASWVHVLPLEAVEFFGDDDDLERGVIEVAEKAARARELSAAELLAMLPAARYSLHRVSLSVEREDADDAGSRSQARRDRKQDRERSAAEKVLAEVGTSLRLQHAKQRQPDVLGRDEEIETLAGLLGGPARLSVVLVGQEKVGKSALLHGLVARSMRGPDLLGGRMVIATSGAQLVAGQSMFGQLEQRIASVMRAAEQFDVILYFDNFADLLSGRPGTFDDMISDMLPFVAEDRVRLVGELTPEQVSYYEKMHVGFFGALSRVTVEPLDKDATRPILDARIRFLKKREPQRPALQPEAVGPLLDLCERYLSYEAFPGKAVRLHDELRAIHESELTEDGEPKPVGPREVYKAFSSRSGIPSFLLEQDRAMKLERIERFFAQRVIGQRDAVQRVAETICMVKANLQPPGKPLANFLFIGPTGVGKTEVAKTLALFLFGGTDRMVRFDMSEYMDPLAAERLIRGTTREEGELTKQVRRQPFCVVLLDEIEKAHPAVFDLLLQVCGEGRLSDARGRTTWFNNAIIIMTSNLGAAHRRPDAGFGTTAAEAPAQYYLDQVEKHFRPEFVGRIDRVIPFSALQRSEVSAVAQVALRKVVERDGLLGRAATLHVSSPALDAVAHDGYSAVYGARALRRHLEGSLVGPVSAVMAKHAAVLDGARVEVVRPDEPMPKPADGFAEESVEHANGLALAVHRPIESKRRRGAHHLARIAHLRRCADRVMHCPKMEKIRERIDYLMADLAGSSRSNERRNRAELNQLTHSLAEGETAANAVAEAEELGMAALVEGADPAMFLEEAEQAFARFEVEFVRMIAAYEGDDCISLFIRSRGGGRVHDVLSVLDAAAEARGWTVTIHRVADPESDGEWPADGRYGPPRTLAWWRERQEDRSTKACALWSAVLVRVRGAVADELLEGEAGNWHFEGEGGKLDVVEIEVMEYEYDIPLSELCPAEKKDEDNDYEIPDPVEDAVLRRSEAHRRWVKSGDAWTVSVPSQSSTFEIESWAEYASLFERVQFEARVEDALDSD